MDLFLKSDLYDILSSLYSHERVMETMEILRNLERPRRYSAFNDSTAWCTKVLEDAGFSDVQRIAHKADGKTASYDFVMPQAWDLLGRSTLEIIEPERKMIADTDISTIYVSEYSAPTPEGGVTAELVAYTALDPKTPDCKGKYVYYPYYLPAQHPLYNTLAKAGCAGIVFAPYGTTAHEPDVPSWTNGHGHIGWYHLKEDPVVPVFCVSPKTGIELSILLSKGKVVLHGEIKAKIYDGEIYTVTGTIPGKSEEEFAILAHLYEPFYADDCQGFAAGVEVALMLKKLIDEGVLPQPEKTLRLIFSMERYGFAAFFANHNKKILAALSIDTITCFGNSIIDRGFVIKESPLSLPFFGDMLLYEAMRTYCSDLRWSMAPGNLSDDCWSSEPTVDIPTNWLVAPSSNGKYDYHHCDAPVFDDVLPKELAKLTPIVAIYTAALVCGDRAHFANMAAELEKTAFDWLEVSRNYIAGETAAGKLTKEEALMYKKAAELLYLGRMESFNRFYPGLIAPKIPAHWADEFYTTLPDRELSVTEQKAAAIRYRITSTGMPFSFDKIPYAERVSWPAIPELIWALLSPDRSVLEAIRLHDGAFLITTSDEKIEYYLSYFRYLAKYGYLEEVL
ncbi:MAG: hypothetical protein IJX01_05040 [Oscillospiraceae bacterium]|nr:hypothetical protein [Oscillospiraceae bacterium]